MKKRRIRHVRLYGAQGSMNMSYDSSNLTTPDIKWLGVRPSDLDRFNIPDQCRLPMTEEDIKTGKRLVSLVVMQSLSRGEGSFSPSQVGQPMNEPGSTAIVHGARN